MAGADRRGRRLQADHRPWLTPDKRWIHDAGLTPDVAVTDAHRLPAGSDPTLDKALELLGAAATSAPASASPPDEVVPARLGALALASRIGYGSRGTKGGDVQ